MCINTRLMCTHTGSADFFGLNHYSSHLCEQPLWYKELPVQQPLPVQPLPVQPLPSPQGQEARQAGDEASSSSSSNNKSDRSKIHQVCLHAVKLDRCSSGHALAEPVGVAVESRIGRHTLQPTGSNLQQVQFA